MAHDIARLENQPDIVAEAKAHMSNSVVPSGQLGSDFVILEVKKWIWHYCREADRLTALKGPSPAIDAELKRLAAN